MPITPAQIEASYTIASAVFHDGMGVNKGESADELHDNHGLNRTSAYFFINNYEHMLKGEVFKKTLSAPAIDYYLKKIRETHGQAKHCLAIASVEQHIKYYETHDRGKLNKLRGVVLRHKALIEEQELGDFETLFQEQVRKSSADTVMTRQARLATRQSQPTQSLVTIKVFNRNPDVVAEVLSRAKGKCEQCKKPAPFIRKSDATSYLEVHHKQQLAQNGLDEVANAIALCPNCHRFFHYGQ